MKALLLLMLALPGSVLAQDAALVGQPWAVNLRADNQARSSFGVRLTIIDPDDLDAHRLDPGQPVGTYANPVVKQSSLEQFQRVAVQRQAAPAKQEPTPDFLINQPDTLNRTW